MNEESIDNQQLKAISKAIVFQVILYTFLTLTFFIAIFNNPLIYYISMFSIYSLVFIITLKKISEKNIKIFFILPLLIFLFIFPLVIFTTYNIYYSTITHLLRDPIGLENNFNFNSFFMYFGYLSFFAIISETVIMIYYYKRYKGFPIEEGFGMWDYFIEGEFSWKKVLLLFTLLSIASIVEEIIFRFIIINVGLRLGLSLLILIIISTIIFGIAHYQNGGWIYCINSTFAGLFFALAFIEMGFFSVWLLHFFWNFLVIFQMFFPIYLEKKSENIQKETNIIRFN